MGETRWDGIEEVVAVAETGAFGTAAIALGISTSHVSRAVARLEQRLEAQLFIRTTRRVTLTDTGRHLVEQFRRLIDEREEALASATGEEEPTGELRITCSTALGERFIAPIVRGFVQEHPKISVTLDLTNRVIDLVAEGYDLGIRTGGLPDSRLGRTKIATRHLHTCAAPDYLAIRGVPTIVEDLEDHNCLIGTNTTWHFLTEGRPVAVHPRGRWRCNSGSATLDSALEGMGVCQLPAFYVADALSRGDLVEVLSAYKAQSEPIWAVYPQKRYLSPRVRLIVTRLTTALHEQLAHAERMMPPGALCAHAAPDPLT